MIATLVNADWSRWKASPVSRQKKDALFELSCRIALIAESARLDDSSGRKTNAGLAGAAKAERRKTLAFGLEILAEGGDAESLDQAFELEPVFRDLDAGTKLELALVRKGLLSIASREHPFVTLRRTTAFLGPEYFDKSSAWMSERLRKRKKRNLPLLVPGELPDVVRALAAEGRSLERALREGGRSLAAAALAGCPQESIDLAAPAFGPLGGAVLADDAVYLRGKLSSEEISQVQSAFLEVLQGLEDGGEVELNAEEELYGDPSFVEEISRAVLEVDDKALKASIRGVDARLLAMAMQGMQPSAHERILGLVTKKEVRRVLDAIDAMILLPRREIEDAGRAFARGLLGALEKAGGGAVSGDAVERLSRIRDWPGAPS
jgi:hypothetical protein